MSEVPTHTLTTPKTNTKVSFKDWITGFDFEVLQNIYLGAERVQDVALEADHKAIELIVLSVGEVKEAGQMVEAVLNLPLVDSKFILDEVKKIADPLEDTPAAA